MKRRGMEMVGSHSSLDTMMRNRELFLGNWRGMGMDRPQRSIPKRVHFITLTPSTSPSAHRTVILSITVHFQRNVPKNRDTLSFKNPPPKKSLPSAVVHNPPPACVTFPYLLPTYIPLDPTRFLFFFFFLFFLFSPISKGKNPSFPLLLVPNPALRFCIFDIYFTRRAVAVAVNTGRVIEQATKRTSSKKTN